MATDKQLHDLTLKLNKYRRKYMRKEFKHLNESDTRLMVDNFLTEILGYKDITEIKTEYRIRGEYADYVIQLKRKKHFVVEVKSIELDLNSKHLRQSLSYAANEGIDWILLMNGREIQLYRVNFGKPIGTNLIYKLDLAKKEDLKKAPQQIWYLTKKAIEKGELEEFWKRSSALQLENLAKLLYCEPIVRRVRNDLKSQTGIYFQLEDVAESLFELITNAVEIRPKLRGESKRRKTKVIETDT